MSRTVFSILFAAVALCVTAVGVYFGLTPVDAGGFLSSCTDWALGFTGRLDGLSLADGPAVIAVGGALQAIKQKRAKLIADARAILDGAADDRLTTADERRFDQLMAEADQLGQRIEREERAAVATASLERRSSVQTVTADAPDVRVVGERRSSWRGRTVSYFRALALKADEGQRAAQLLGDLARRTAELPDDQRRAELQEAEQIVQRSGLPEARQAVIRRLLDLGEYRTLTTEANDAKGGDSLLPAPFLAQLFVLIEEYGVARRLFRVIPYTGPGNTLSLKQIATKVTSYWVDQAELIPGSDFEFADADLTMKKLAGITSWATEVDEDAAFDLLPIAIQAFAESISEKEDKAGFLGDGTSTYGGFTGVLNLASATVVNTGGTNLASITEEKLRAAKLGVSRSQRGRAQWVMHESIMDHIRQLENTAGFRLFTESLADGGAINLLGYPVIFNDVYPAASSLDSNDEPILSFGDHSRMLMAIKRDITADVSREAILQSSDTGDIVYNAYQADGALIRVTERVGFAMPSAVQGAIVVLKTQAAGS